MRSETIYKTSKATVKTMYIGGELLYVRTYIWDNEGYVEKMVTVYADGSVDVQGGEDNE